MKTHKDILPVYVVLVLIAHGVYFFQKNYSLAISSTPSLPYNIFFIDKKDIDIQKDDLVVFNYPGKDIYIYKTGEKFVKMAKCFPNDVLFVNDNREYYCNGKKIAQAPLYDSQGKKLSLFKFNGSIPKDNYFAIGTHPKSWDSKYWGFVNKENIIGKAKGLF